MRGRESQSQAGRFLVMGPLELGLRKEQVEIVRLGRKRRDLVNKRG